MRAIVTSSKSWVDTQSVIDVICELPVGTVILLPSKLGACKVIIDNADDLKFEVEDWFSDYPDYERNGSKTNAEMLQTDVDIVIAFLSHDSYAAKDCVRQAHFMDIDVKVLNTP